MGSAVVIACHPDDETLGAGGTLIRHKAEGDKIYWVIVTCITKGGHTEKMMAKRKKEIVSVSRLYDFDRIYEFEIPTTQAETVPVSDLIGRISKVFNEVRPDTVYLPFRSDIHSDHRAVFDAAYACTKKFRYPFIKKIAMMEALSETEFAPSLKNRTFIPNYFVDISDYIEKKIKIMKRYSGEMENHPSPRSVKNIRALATFRGATAGCAYAESFMMLKEMR